MDLDTKAVATVGGNELMVAAGEPPATVDGPADKARFNCPVALAIFNKCKSLLVAERVGCSIRRLELGSGKITTVCGAPGVRYATVYCC